MHPNIIIEITEIHSCSGGNKNENKLFVPFLIFGVPNTLHHGEPKRKNYLPDRSNLDTSIYRDSANWGASKSSSCLMIEFINHSLLKVHILFFTANSASSMSISHATKIVFDASTTSNP